MTKKNNCKISFSTILVLFCSYFVYTQSIETLVSSFAGSSLLSTYEVRYAPLTLLVEPFGAKNYPSELQVEGGLVTNIYEQPSNVSSFEILKSYQKVLKNADFDIILACEEVTVALNPKIT